MEERKLYLGETLLKESEMDVSLKTVDMDNEVYFKMEHYDQMPPFFMTIVSDVDFWLFISSTGGLTAGRKNPDSALFPYETDDKIHDASETTGSHTVVVVYDHENAYLWKPFSSSCSGVYPIVRNLYKNALGNKIVFEEINETFNLTFRYTYKTSNEYGLIKTSELINGHDSNRFVKVLDGIRNILPYGVDTALQSMRSTLVDGYKRSELYEECGLGIFTLSSIISDKAEPSESLKSTTVWSSGLDTPKYLLSEIQVRNFEKNQNVKTEYDVKGRRGAFYVSDEFFIEAHSSKKWVIVSEINQSASNVESLIKEISKTPNIIECLEADVSKGDLNLKKLVFEADGFQMSANANVAHRHFSNTLYNIMRGGIYANGYEIDKSDLMAFVSAWNKTIFDAQLEFLNALPTTINYFELLEQVQFLDDLSFERLIREYLPLTYSRRHGDPSRPWNKFNIEIFNESGDKKLNFEGNWRDIFQNWEALSLSYPGYIESIITKFVNASTVDGYNPYRITKEGVDWEVLDPADPWSNIGYWGDHQVIYLLKLLELSNRYKPNVLFELLDKEMFVYSNVPYRIKGFEALKKDSSNTILFDDALASLIDDRVKKIGSDGKLVFFKDAPYRVNLLEKLLLVALSKLSNYVPSGGIWMNTQRPEWNDANNALVGNGVSMVTLYYLNRYLDFIMTLIQDAKEPVLVSEEVACLFGEIFEVLKENISCVETDMTDTLRYKITSQLGSSGEAYRRAVYSDGFSGKKSPISMEGLKDFIHVAMRHIKSSIDENRREDGLYHAYNLLKFKGDSISITPLYEMLEGQVAVLSSKALSGKESLSVIKALRNSSIYRGDQNSYMLYPDRELPRFLDKNIIPENDVEVCKILKSEIQKGYSRFVEKDVSGKYRFNGSYRNAEELMDAILKTGEYSESDALAVGNLFSDLFKHHAFTGRSGTFYKYEGLGCIYWHMVSKLLVAAQENYDLSIRSNEDQEVIEGLATAFHEIKRGIGAEKSPVAYGAFPTDAYSHTPSFSGVQQPGMTGQVKEDFIARFAELGLSVSEGEISFEPSLLLANELLDSNRVWQLPDKSLELEKNQLGFTLCSVPVVYEKSNYKAITIVYHNGDQYTFEYTSKLSREISQSIFNREGKIAKVLVRVKF